MSSDVMDGAIQYIERKFAEEIEALRKACDVQAQAIATLTVQRDEARAERDELARQLLEVSRR